MVRHGLATAVPFGPEHDLGGEDVVLRKQRVLFAEDPLDRRGVQNLREGQAFVPQKRLDDRRKLVLVTRSTSGYSNHDKALPGFVGQPSQEGPR